MKALQRRLVVASLFAAGLLVVGQAVADQLIFITGDKASLRDSSNLSVVIDEAAYSLPEGFGVVGGDIDPDNGKLGLLARNASTNACQVFVEGDDVGDSLSFNPAGPVIGCTANVGDLEFLPSGGGTDLGWAIAGPASWVIANPSSPQYSALPVSSTDGSIVDLAAIAVHASSGVGRMLTRGGSFGALAFQSGDSALSFVNPVAVSGAVIAAPTSMDVAESSGTVYLLTDGKVYSVADSGVATLVGTAPAGTLVMFTALDDGDDGGNNDGGDNGGGGGDNGNVDDQDESSGGGVKVGALGWPSLLLLLLAWGFKQGFGSRRYRK